MIRLDNLAVTTIPDQIGKPMLVILGVDALGRLWQKQGDQPWRIIPSPTHEDYQASVAQTA